MLSNLGGTQPRWIYYSRLSLNGHLELVPAFLYFFYLTLYKTDTSLRRTLSVGPKGVRLGESRLYKRFYKSNSHLIKQNLSVCVEKIFHVCQNISLITENVLLKSFPQIFPYNYT